MKTTHIVHIYFLNGQQNVIECENLQRAQNIAKYAKRMNARNVVIETI